ncbi:MAG TPA: CHAT domain-containing tetratricopeptide repeat protein [Thermoanaerobaculia bacterium]|jgi:CHAT domain-containing protein/tetratricopeptide (TPR) repeat protein
MNPTSAFGRPAPHPRGVIPFCVLLALVLGGAAGAPSPAGPELKAGVTVERELKGGETHVYPIDLQAGQFLRVSVQEQGIDVEVVLLDPRGAFVTGSDWLSFGDKQALEDLAAVVATPGRYLLKVRSGDKAALPGRYRLEVLALRTAEGDDTFRSEATRATWDGLHASPPESGKAQLERALGLWDRLGERRRMAEALVDLGDIHADNLDERETAVEDYLRSAALWSELTDPEAKSWRSTTLNRLGNQLKELGRRDEARKVYEEAVAISGGLRDANHQAASLNNLGLLALDQGETQRAATVLLEAAQKARQGDDKVTQANTLSNLGLAYLQMAEGQAALRQYREALVLARAVASSGIEAQVENNLGDTYHLLGDMDAALEHFHAALQIDRRLGRHTEEARVLLNLGDSLQRLRRFAEARQAFDQALAVARALKDREIESFSLDRQAALFLSLNRPAEGLAPAEEALRLSQGFPAHEIGAVYTLGKIHREIGEMKKARAELERAWRLARERSEPSLEADVDLSLAKLEQIEGHPLQALDRARSAIEIDESLRTRVSDQRLRTSFLATRQISYEIYIDLLMAAAPGGTPDPERVSAAFAVSERARARSLLDILGEAGTDIRTGADPALLERERRLRDEVNARDGFRLKLLAQAQPDRKDLAEAERKLGDALAQYSQVQADLKSGSPAYAALTQPQPLSLAEIQAQILDGKALLLEYALGDKRSFLWAVTPDAVRSFELPARGLIEPLARRYYELLTARNQHPAGETLQAWKQRIERADAEAERTGRDLSRVILGPVERLLGDRPLLIVADGALQYIPFAALPVSSKGVPLAARHDVVSLPSASALAVLRREIRDRPRAPKALAIFGDPVFQATDERLASVPGKRRPGKVARMNLAAATRDGWNPSEPRQGDEERPTFRRLPSSAREARAIAALVPPAQRLLALGFDASRARALSPELAQYRDLHFATHGVLDSRRPELSKLVLSLFDAKGKPEDGFLRLNDIYNLRLDADLVVLSACRTALGQEIRGEGLVGLTRGFMYAGAARVLASLWSVEDRATADLMASFYRDRLRQRLPPATALRRAQLEIARQPGRKSPYYWAGFSLQGEWH